MNESESNEQCDDGVHDATPLKNVLPDDIIVSADWGGFGLIKRIEPACTGIDLSGGFAEHVLDFACSGAGREQQVRDGRRVEYERQQDLCNFVPSRHPITWEWECNDPIATSQILIPPDVMSSHFSELYGRTKSIELKHGFHFQDAGLNWCRDALEREATGKGWSCRLFVDTVRGHLIDLLLTRYAADGTPFRTARDRRLGTLQLSRALEVLHGASVANISLEDIAQHVELSSAYLCRAFRMTTGIPPHEYLLRLRTDAIEKRLLESKRGEIDLAALALEFGFSDQSHMGRVFKRLKGNTPGRLLKLTN